MTNLADRLRRSRDSGIWRVPAFRLLVTGQFTSSIGDAFYVIALPRLILAQRGGSAELGVVVATYGVARAMGIVSGGALAGRLGPRPVMAVADTVRFAVSTGLGVLAVAGHIPVVGTDLGRHPARRLRRSVPAGVPRDHAEFAR